MLTINRASALPQTIAFNVIITVAHILYIVFSLVCWSILQHENYRPRFSCHLVEGCSQARNNLISARTRITGRIHATALARVRHSPSTLQVHYLMIPVISKLLKPLAHHSHLLSRLLSYDWTITGRGRVLANGQLRKQILQLLFSMFPCAETRR